MQKSLNRLKEAMKTPPRIRAACLWGDNLEHRIDFDAAFWLVHTNEDIIMSHFEDTVRVHLPGGDSVGRFEGEHPEWAFMELVTELPEEYPGAAEMFAWLADKGAAGFAVGDEDPGVAPMTELIEVYLSRADALEWLRQNRPDLFADIRSTYALPPPERRFFP